MIHQPKVKLQKRINNIYIYIERERERESPKKRKADKVQNTQVGVFHYQDLCKSFYHGDRKTMPPKKRYFNFSMLSLLFGTHLLSFIVY